MQSNTKRSLYSNIGIADIGSNYSYYDNNNNKNAV